MFTFVKNSLIPHDEEDNLISERGSTGEMDRVKKIRNFTVCNTRILV